LRHKQLLVVILVLVILAVAVIVKMPIKKGLDIAGGIRIVYQADMTKLAAGQKPGDALNGAVRVIRDRAVGAIGVTEPLIQPKPSSNQIIVELPDLKEADKDKAISMLGSTAQMEFRHFNQVHYATAQRWRPAAGKYTMQSETDPKTGGDMFSFSDANGNEVKPSVVLDSSTLILSGDDLKPTAKATKDPQNFGTVVAIEFTPRGRQKFADFTRKNVGEILAIVLDGKILSAPTIEEPILNGSAVIRGKFTPQEAQTLAEFINAGALPIPLKIAQVQSVEATLGASSVSRSVDAGVGGLVLVLLFMALYYLLPGLLADLALAIYAVLTLALFKLMGVTMTLPGIAAFILSIGMAVDANILIFERLKEELRSGKTLRAAIDTGFARAFTSIFDSNMCTLITCIILFNYGTGPIKGFAVILALGVIISMFTAITATRTLLHTLVNAGFAQDPKMYGLGRQWVTGKTEHQVNIVGRMWLWFGISAAVILPGLYFLCFAHGLKPGIDFTGGSLTQVQFTQPVTSTASIDDAFTKAGLIDNQIQKSKDDVKEVFVRSKTMDGTKYLEVKGNLETIGGKVLQSESVGPVVSKELTDNAVKAVIIAAILIVLYLSVRFAIGGLANGFRFGVCAILATFHDVGVIIGIFAILGHFLNWEIDSLFITALLTVIGFSTHDTIVIFDRIRENLRHRARGEAFDGLVNRSILQSFARSINTSFTVILTLVAMVAFGAINIRHFTIALLIGVITGTYSSIFNASQLLVLWTRYTEKGKIPQAAVAGKPLVDVSTTRAEKARELKPVVEGADANGEGQEAVTASKAKAKKRKKRF
jgi:SecD/SecF fusion protein